MSVTFYTDKSNNFSCGITIKGATLSESKARLVLAFPDKSIMFNGKISSNGEVSIDMPAIKESHNSGKATLEIIADSVFFEAWESPFKLEAKKGIQVESVSVNPREDKRVVIENVSIRKEKPIEKLIIKENVSRKNRYIISNILEMFNGDDKMLIKPTNKKVLSWIDKNFKDTNSKKAIFVGMVLENRLKQQKGK